MSETIPWRRVTRCAFAGICFFAVACGREFDERELPAPLARIRQHGAYEFFVQARPGVSIDQLVDLAGFDGLEPGQDFDRVETVLGEPVHVFREDGRDEVRAFSSRLDGRVEVVKQTTESEGVYGESWFLRFAPNRPCFPCYMKPPLWQAVPNAPTRLILSLSADDGKVDLELNAKRLVRIWWLRDGPVVHPVPPRTQD
jgi:hypothetical protein